MWLSTFLYVYLTTALFFCDLPAQDFCRFFSEAIGLFLVNLQEYLPGKCLLKVNMCVPYDWSTPPLGIYPTDTHIHQKTRAKCSSSELY